MKQYYGGIFYRNTNNSRLMSITISYEVITFR